MRTPRLVLALASASLIALTSLPASAATPLAPGSALWTSTFDHAGPGWSADGGYEMQSSPDGATAYVLGWADNEEAYGFVVLAYDQLTGAELWSHVETTDDGVYASTLALSPDGSTLYVGLEDDGIFVLAIDTSTGDEVWRQLLVLPEESRWPSINGLVSAPDGESVLVAGNYELPHNDGRGFAASLATDTGETDWFRNLGTKRRPLWILGAILSGDGTGLMLQAATWGGDLGDGGTGEDIAVTTLSVSDGARIWTGIARVNGHQEPEALAVSPDGSAVVVVGQEYYSYTRTKGFALGMSGTDGSVLWSRWFGKASGRDFLRAVAITPDGATAVMTGQATTTADRGADVLTVALDPADGVVAWKNTYDGSYPANNNEDRGLDLAIAPDGNSVFVAGRVNGDTYSAGNFSVLAYAMSDGGQDWEYEADGTGLWPDVAYAITTSPDGSRVLATGRFGQELPNGSDVATVALEAT